MRKTDFPRVCAWDKCPVCGNPKSRGELACYPCWNTRQPDCDDDPYFWRLCQRAELALKSVGTKLATKLRNVLDRDDQLHERNVRHRRLMKGA